MSVAFILNPGYNTINNVHHTFWDQGEDCVANESLNPVLAVATSLSAPSHIVTGGTNPAQLFMSDPITLETDAPQFKAPILQTASAELEEVTELTPAAGITFLNDVHFTSGTGPSTVVRDIDGVGTLTCDTLKYTTLDPAIPSADVSQWATFGASANVNLNGKLLTDTTQSNMQFAKPISAVSSISNTGSEFGNSIDDSSIAGTITLWTNRNFSGANRGQLNVRAANTTGGTAFWANPRSITLNDGGYGGDIQLSTSGSGKYRLLYDNSNKALTVNQSGALCFNSTFGANTPVEGSFGTAGQIVQSNGSSAPPSWVNAPSASNWSTFDATSDVDLAGFSLTDSTRSSVFIPQNITSLDPTGLGETMIGNSVNDTTKPAKFLLQTNYGNSGDATTRFWQNPNNAVVTGTNFYNKPRACVILPDGDLILQPNAGSVRIPYNNGSGAITFDTLGAISFNSTVSNGVVTIGNRGTAGQIVQSNGASAPPSWVNAPSASNWSTYDATSDVDLAGYRLTNSSTTDEKIVYATSSTADPFAAMMVTKTASSATADDITFIGSEIYPTSGASTSFNIVTKNSGAIKKTDKYGDLPGSATFVSFNASANILSNDAGNSTIITYDTSRKGIEFNNYGCIAFDSVCNAGATPPTPGSFGTAGQVLQSNGSTVAPSWVSPAISGQYVLYVAKDGLDTNAGDITHPKLTIQSAINTATALYPQQVVILVQPGVYSGALSITRPNITLLGLSPSSQQNLLTQIAGNISIACTASQDLYYSQVCIANLLVSGSIIDTSTVVHTLNIEACRIAANGQVFAQTSSADNRTRLVKCTLLQASLTADVNPMMLFSSGAILLNQLDVTAKNNCNLVKFNGTSTLPTCALCTFTSDSASPVAEPIVLLAPTNGANKPFTFGYNAFIYSSYAPKLAHPESAGICVSSAAGRPYITVAYNSFALAGTDATNYAIYDTGYNTATAGYYFYFSNNGGINPAGINAVIPSLVDFAPQAHHIYGNTGGGSQNKFTLTPVV